VHGRGSGGTGPPHQPAIGARSRKSRHSIRDGQPIAAETVSAEYGGPESVSTYVPGLGSNSAPPTSGPAQQSYRCNPGYRSAGSAPHRIIQRPVVSRGRGAGVSDSATRSQRPGVRPREPLDSWRVDPLRRLLCRKQRARQCSSPPPSRRRRCPGWYHRGAASNAGSPPESPATLIR